MRGPSSAGLLLLLGPASVPGYCCYVCSPGRASSSSSLSLLLPSPLTLRMEMLQKTRKEGSLSLMHFPSLIRIHFLVVVPEPEMLL